MKTEEKEQFSDEEINAIADWLQELTLPQLSFLKHSYEEMLKVQAREQGHEYVH